MCRCFLRWLFKRDVDIHGVVYSDDINVKAEMDRLALLPWQGSTQNLRTESISDVLRRNQSRSDQGPEEVPFSFWERIGIVPVHPSRVRPRQFYHPITDFALHDYDECSPEEKELLSKWMARATEFDTTMPLGILCASSMIVLPFHTMYRMPLLIGIGFTSVMAEIIKSYMAAFQQRQDLDDFILAKEIWYIKNIETYQLQLPRIPRGREKEYQDCMNSSIAVDGQELPQHLIDAMHI